MDEAPISLSDIAMLSHLANGIIPADDRDSGAASVHAGPSIAARMRFSPYADIYVTGLKAANDHVRTVFGKEVKALSPEQIHELLMHLSESTPAFFRQLRADVCALYLSDPGVWKRIGFPGASTELPEAKPLVVCWAMVVLSNLRCSRM